MVSSTHYNRSLTSLLKAIKGGWQGMATWSFLLVEKPQCRHEYCCRVGGDASVDSGRGAAVLAAFACAYAVFTSFRVFSPLLARDHTANEVRDTRLGVVLAGNILAGGEMKLGNAQV